MFDTAVARLSVGEKKRIKKKDWRFDWYSELAAGREVYTLTTVQNPSIIQGLIALEDRPGHVFVHLVENARFN